MIELFTRNIQFLSSDYSGGLELSWNKKEQLEYVDFGHISLIM